MGWGRLFHFPHHFLCLLPDLGELGGHSVWGQEEMLGGGGSWLHDSPGIAPLSPAHSPSRAAPLCGRPRLPPERMPDNGGQCIHRVSLGYYEVILFLSISGKNSKYKIIFIKVKIHHLDFVVVL